MAITVVNFCRNINSLLFENHQLMRGVNNIVLINESLHRGRRNILVVVIVRKLMKKNIRRKYSYSDCDMDLD